MAKLSYKQRSALPDSVFAVVKTVKGKKVRKYPCQDASHARNALARVSQFGTPAEKAAVKKKVASKYPKIEIRKKKGK